MKFGQQLYDSTTSVSRYVIPKLCKFLHLFSWPSTIFTLKLYPGEMNSASQLLSPLPLIAYGAGSRLCLAHNPSSNMCRVQNCDDGPGVVCQYREFFEVFFETFLTEKHRQTLERLHEGVRPKNKHNTLSTTVKSLTQCASKLLFGFLFNSFNLNLIFRDCRACHSLAWSSTMKNCRLYIGDDRMGDWDNNFIAHDGYAIYQYV